MPKHWEDAEYPTRRAFKLYYDRDGEAFIVHDDDTVEYVTPKDNWVYTRVLVHLDYKEQRG